MNPAAPAFLRLVKHPLKLRLFLLGQLPSAYFSGVRVEVLDAGHAVVSVPYKWFSRNPFRSTYFACLAMAAEMSTGLLAMTQVYKRKPAVSMLVVELQATYFKKATGRSFFTCMDGPLFEQAVEDAIKTGEAKTIQALSTGVNKAGEKVAEFRITWSVKRKN